jgi:hypothetical protein
MEISGSQRIQPAHESPACNAKVSGMGGLPAFDCGFWILDSGLTTPLAA